MWEADCFAMYRGITDDAYDKPLNERYFLVMDQKLNMVLDNQLLLPEDGAREVMNRLESIILENGRPKKVIVPNQIVGSMLKTLCDACGIRLVVDETECCEEYKLITSGQIDPERIMEELEELGIDIDKLNENISKMTQEEFVENMMAELEEVLGEEFGDLWDIDEVEHELKNRKQKVCAVKEFFGQGILPEEYYDEVEKWIESDWADDWEELLMQSTKLQLLDMAVQMGILTGKNTSKGALANTIMHTAKKDAGTLIGLLTGDELKMLKMLEDDMDDMTWNMEGEFPFAREQILKLLGFGLVDIGYFTGEADITLVVKPVREVMELIAN